MSDITMVSLFTIAELYSEFIDGKQGKWSDILQKNIPESTSDALNKSWHQMRLKKSLTHCQTWRM